MRIAKLMERVLNRLAAIPGLRFLGGYVVSAKASHTRFGQRKGDYEGYINNAQGAFGDVRDALGGPRQKGDDEFVGDDDDDDHEEVEYDYYDLYEDEGDSVYADGGNDPLDDYPASDENISYYDDDYPSR